VYEGVGHIVQWEQPERVAADTAAFAATLEHNHRRRFASGCRRRRHRAFRPTREAG
jgi:hypothetical protein